MVEEPTPGTEPRGVAPSLRAALQAGILTGLVFGVVDGLMAAWYGRAIDGVSTFLGCMAAAILSYGAFWVIVLAGLGVVLHPVLRGRDRAGRVRFLSSTGLGLGLFFELYWWTRPLLFYGHSSTSPERLVTAAVLMVVGLVGGVLLARLVARLPRPVPTLMQGFALFAMASAVIYLALEQQAIARRGELNDRNRDLPNVMLIVVDALRSDVIGAYGSETVSTPVMDELAERGVLFENTFVQAPYTWTSFGSILTGKYPRRHGLVKMVPGVRMRPNVTLPWHLKNATRAQGAGLRDGDYFGSTFMTGTLSHGSGLMRGFDVYFEALAGHELVYLDSRWSRFRSDLLLWIFKNKITQRLDSSLVVTTARQWLRANQGRRFVSMVHLYSTHTPYDPPQKYRDMYLDPDYDGPIERFYASDRIAIERGEYELTPADWKRIQNLYYAGTTQADDMIGEILAELDAAGVLEDTLVMVTSDHGEELGDHGLLEHNYMYQTNLRIPLIVSWPRGLPEGRRVSSMVETIDILPTVCDLLDIELPSDPEAEERGLIDGVSLMPLVRGELDSVREYSFAENGRFLSVQDAKSKLIVRRGALAPECWEKAMSGGAELPRFFDLEADPDEHQNVVMERREDAERLLEVLRKWDASMPIPLEDLIESHRDLEAERARFDGLGYTEGGVGIGVEEDQPRRISSGSSDCE